MSSTIKDVAIYAGVSPTTVSRVINQKGYVSEEVRQKVMDAIKVLEYTPNLIAVSLTQKRMPTIGVIVPDICNSFFNEVFYEASKVAESHNYRVILYNTDDSVKMETAALQDMISYRVSGIIMTPVSDKDATNSDLLNSLKGMGIPVVFVDREMQGVDCDGVFVDNIRGAYDATTLLLRAGHRRIAVIAGPEDTIPGRERVIGYKNAFQDWGLELKPEYVINADFKMDKSFRATTGLLELKEPPTAFFACNNRMTLGCINGIISSGRRIPQDVALVGFDDIELLDILGMRLSTVSRATGEMGAVAMRLLLEHLSENDARSYQKIVLQTHLKVCGSEVMP